MRTFCNLTTMIAAIVLTGLMVCERHVAAAEKEQPKAQPKARPNVVIVITDDQGYGDVGAHGNKVIRTPTLDRLHGESVRLTNYHVDPTCAPTRSALMTGRYSGRVGVWHTIMGRSMLRGDEKTMADVFAASGYRTGMFGKWHLGDNYPFRPQDRGFQHVVCHGGGGVGQTPDYWGNDYFDDTYFHNGKPQKHKGYCTDIWFDEAMKFIEASKDKPFFCYLSTNAPHGPFLVAPRYEKMYAGKANVPNAPFYGMITNIDDNMARLDKKLKELGIADNTILIFTTDNGTAAGFKKNKGFNAGMKGTKGSQYEGGHRVPMFVRWPGGDLKHGTDVGNLSAHLDMLPTMIELCGLKAPADVKFDGTSVAPLLRGKSDAWKPRTLVVESQRIQDPAKWRKCSVMTDQWRLVDGKELYDIVKDPGQKTNVASGNPKVVAELRKAYESWWRDVSKRHGEYCRTVVGTEHENPVTFTCHDWTLGGFSPWNQGHIRRGQPSGGQWAIHVAKPGKYAISLRRWPIEADTAINAAAASGKAISPPATKARLKIGKIDETKPIADGAKEVTFTVELPAGPAMLESWLLNGKQDKRGAYYAYVKRLE
jgi:arylsulfatase A-like enzyme